MYLEKLDYLENLIYSFDRIKNISKGFSNLDVDYKKQV